MSTNHPAPAATMSEQTADGPTLDAKHFEFLRLARLRGLTVRKIGAGVYCVPSHSQKADGIQWVVTLPVEGSARQVVTCSCPAGRLSYCSHRAVVVDRYFVDEAPGGDFCLYNQALISDRTQLRLRIRANELTRLDKIYLRYAAKVYAQKHAAVKVPAITEKKVREGRRTRTLTRCGAFTI